MCSLSGGFYLCPTGGLPVEHFGLALRSLITDLLPRIISSLEPFCREGPSSNRA